MSGRSASMSNCSCPLIWTDRGAARAGTTRIAVVWQPSPPVAGDRHDRRLAGWIGDSGRVARVGRCPTIGRETLPEHSDCHDPPQHPGAVHGTELILSLIHISEPTRLGMISYAVFCLKKKKKQTHKPP